MVVEGTGSSCLSLCRVSFLMCNKDSRTLQGCGENELNSCIGSAQCSSAKGFDGLMSSK